MKKKLLKKNYEADWCLFCLKAGLWMLFSLKWREIVNNHSMRAQMVIRW